jgi:hypothetical protein
MKKFLFIVALVAFTFVLGQIVFAQKDNGLGNKERGLEKMRYSSTSPTSTPAYPAVCLQNAVTAREDGIIAANNVRSAAINTALQNRKTALVTAYGLTDRLARNKARTVAWNDFNKARKIARNSYNTTTRALWKTFHTAAKACGVKTQSVEPEGLDQSWSD